MFERLQSSAVDPQMVGGEPDKTLFDFVDAETVQSLQQEALEQAKECVGRVAGTTRGDESAVCGVF